VSDANKRLARPYYHVTGGDLVGLSDREIRALAEAFAGPGFIAHNRVFAITPFDLYSAMVAADALGQERRRLAAAGN
jgi:hypothetical protein